MPSADVAQRAREVRPKSDSGTVAAAASCVAAASSAPSVELLPAQKPKSSSVKSAEAAGARRASEVALGFFLAEGRATPVWATVGEGDESRRHRFPRFEPHAVPHGGGKGGEMPLREAALPPLQNVLSEGFHRHQRGRCVGGWSHRDPRDIDRRCVRPCATSCLGAILRARMHYAMARCSQWPSCCGGSASMFGVMCC